jgi:hypothetical protein
MSMIYLVDADGRFALQTRPAKDSNNDVNKRIARLEAAGYTHATSPPPNETSKWNGSAWIADQELVDAKALYDVHKARRNAYPQIGDQLDMMYHDLVDGTRTWRDAVEKVKADNPKPDD